MRCVLVSTVQPQVGHSVDCTNPAAFSLSMVLREPLITDVMSPRCGGVTNPPKMILAVLRYGWISLEWVGLKSAVVDSIQMCLPWIPLKSGLEDTRVVNIHLIDLAISILTVLMSQSKINRN